MTPTHVPIYVASLGPANLRLTGELADGWIGNSFFPETADAFLNPIRDGAVSAGRTLADLDLTVSVGIEFTTTSGRPDVATLKVTPSHSARWVQRRRTTTTKHSPARATATTFGLGTNLVGTDDLIRERLRLYRNAGITTLRAGLQGDVANDLQTQIDDLGRLLDLVGEVNAET